MPYVSIWADVNRIYGTVSYLLWMNRKYVGSYWCMFQFERVIILCMMQYDTITIAHSKHYDDMITIARWFTTLNNVVLVLVLMCV